MRASADGEKQPDDDLQNKLEDNIDLKIHKFFDLGKRLRG